MYSIVPILTILTVSDDSSMKSIDHSIDLEPEIISSDNLLCQT